DGVRVVRAWLDALEATQPQHGPLLQRTVDAVGGLPAVSEDGSIRTISDRSFWVAAGFAQTYATRAADRRRIQAVLDEAQAGELKDEPTMVQKEAEAEFWSSIQAWIESNGAARMRSDPLPGWLLRLDAESNSGR